MLRVSVGFTYVAYFVRVGLSSPPATSTPQAFSVDSAPNESIAIASLDSASAQELRSLAFAEIENIIKKSWWQAARAAVIGSHRVRLDFTAPVRRAVGEMKQEADILLRWLDPRYAHPAATSMATRWQQNETAVMVAARFAPQWDAPGATVSVFTSAGGRGHVDKEKTAEQVQKMLHVEIFPDRITAEITAESANARKRYTLDQALFDEIVPERSSWTVNFLRAQGSMQMSKGAQIPELWFLLRKRWRNRPEWPRLTSAESTNVSLLLAAPGLPKRKSPQTSEMPKLQASEYTCRLNHSYYCHSLDHCVPDCDRCEGSPRPNMSRCYGMPQDQIYNVGFLDQDPYPGTIGGKVYWWQDFQDSQVERFHLYWGFDAGHRLKDAPLLTVPSLGDARPAMEVPEGTKLAAGVKFFHVLASNPLGEVLVAVVPIVDVVKPPAPVAFRNFTDKDPRAGFISGTARIAPALEEDQVLAYELHWGRAAKHSSVPRLWPRVFRLAPLVSSIPSDARAGDGLLDLVRQEAVRIPFKSASLLVVAVGSGGGRSEPAVLPLLDASPPNMKPKELKIGPDNNPIPGIVSFDVIILPGSCKGVSSKTKKRDTWSPPVDTSRPCDEGSSFSLYWTDREGRRLSQVSTNLMLIEGHSNVSTALENVEIPEGATALMVFGLNSNGESEFGTKSSFVDDRSAEFMTWKKLTVLALGDNGAAALWWPFTVEVPGCLECPQSHKQLTGDGHMGPGVITAVAIAGSGDLAVCGFADGGIILLDLKTDSIELRVSGRGAVTALHISSSNMKLLRGTRSGLLDTVNLKSGIQGLSLAGHTTSIETIEADWARKRAATLLSGGKIWLWELTGEQDAPTFSSEVEGVHATSMTVDWMFMRLLVGTGEETVEIYNISGGHATKDFLLEGHSDAVNFVSTNWTVGRALTVSRENTVKVWDLLKRECVFTFHSFEKLDPVVAVSVSWETNTAIALFKGGSGQLFSVGTQSSYQKIGGGACVDAAMSHGNYKQTSVQSSDRQNCQKACDAVDTCTGYDDRADGCLLYHSLKIVGSNNRGGMTCYMKATKLRQRMRTHLNDELV